MLEVFSCWFLVHLTLSSLCVRRVYQGLLVRKVKRASLVLRQVSVWLKAVIFLCAFEMFSLSFLFLSIHFPQGTRGVEGNIGSPGITGPRVRQPYLYAFIGVSNACFYCTLFYIHVYTFVGFPGFAWSSRASGRERASRSCRAHREKLNYSLCPWST